VRGNQSKNTPSLAGGKRKKHLQVRRKKGDDNPVEGRDSELQIANSNANITSEKVDLQEKAQKREMKGAKGSYSIKGC